MSTPDAQHERIDELFALAALGELTEADEVELDAALSGDVALNAELRADLHTAALLQAVHAEDPPATLKISVLEAIAGLDQDAATGATEHGEPIHTAPGQTEPTYTKPPPADMENDWPNPVESLDAARRTRRRSVWQPLAAAAAVIMLIAGGVVVANRDSGSTDFDKIATANDGQQRRLVGNLGGDLDVVFSPSQEAFVLRGTDIPVLTDAETYQLWFVDGAAVSSVGLFRPDTDGKVAQVFGDLDPSEVTVAVTIEPAAGSVSPTLPIVAQA